MTQRLFDLIVVGGGASGFYGAIQYGEKKPGQEILILEKSTKVLSKVKVSGGGRCNVTNFCFEPISLSKHYPRGEKQLKQLFKKYQAADVVNWFMAKGVELKAEDDGRMFPVTNRSETIIECFLKVASQLKIEIKTSTPVQQILSEEERFTVYCQAGQYHARRVLICTGGHANIQAYQWIEALGHTIHLPMPSLFTFNDCGKKYADLMGISVVNAMVRIVGTKFIQKGPLLITHWGLSGPAIIKLSAWAATYLHDVNYHFHVLVSWIGDVKEDVLRNSIHEHRKNHGKQKVMSNPLFGLPQRLWLHLCADCGIDQQKIWAELPQKNTNKLIELMIRTPFEIKGKTTFKEEFVTCGGIDLTEVDLEKIESKKIKNLFFAGEVLNIDGETGGYNFQAAWTTAALAAQAMANS